MKVPVSFRRRKDAAASAPGDLSERLWPRLEIQRFAVGLSAKSRFAAAVSARVETVGNSVSLGLFL